jgi:hypothetical protein
MVLPIALELASIYAQGMGRRETWVCGVPNDVLAWHLIGAYGFEIAKPKGQTPFFRRIV